MEYMASGTPVISYRLEGIPDEYFSYMYTIDDDIGEEAIFNILERVLSKPDDELIKLGQSAREYVLSKKNATAQTAKILEMIELLVRG